MTTQQRKPKNTARVRRGYRHVIKHILEDTDYNLLDPKAPWLRRLKGADRTDAVTALRYMLLTCEAQSGPVDAGEARPGGVSP